MEATRDLDGRVAVVTGGSRGIGRAIASGLAAAGARVAVNFAHSVQPAEDTVAAIRTAGGTAAAVRADVTTADGAAHLIAATREEFGGVDIVVNNATGPQPSIPVEAADWDDHLDQLRFTVAAPVHVGRAALGAMRERGWGRIVNVGSEVVGRPSPGLSAYTTGKAAMVGLTRAWATELGSDGITVNLVAPGFVPVERHGELAEDERAAYLADVPVGRMGEPRDIADVVVWLASERAAFVTGQVITVNGGRTVTS